MDASKPIATTKFILRFEVDLINDPLLEDEDLKDMITSTLLDYGFNWQEDATVTFAVTREAL